MIKSTKAKTPTLRFPEFFGEWEEKKLREVATIERGRFSPRPRNDPKYYGGDIPFVQTGDIVKAGGMIKDYTQTLNQKGVKVSKLFPKDTILITIAANIGYTGILDIPMACPDSLVGIMCKDNMNNLFLNYYLSMQRSRMNRIASEAAQKNINIEFLKPYPVTWTTLKEQQKIASFLTTADDWITTLKKQKKALEEYKKGMVQKIFSQKIRFKDDDGKEYPKWEEKRLGAVVRFGKGGTLSKSDIVDNGKYRCIHYGELFTEYAEVIHEVKSRTNVNTNVNSEAGDILMPTSDVTPRGLAKASVILVDGVKIGGDVNILKPANVVDSIFLSYMLNFYKKKIMRIVSGTTIRHVYSSDLGKITYYIPPSVEEQKKIASFLSSLDDLINLSNQRITLAEEWKKGVMQRMFV